MKLPTLGLGIVVIGSVFVIGPIAMVELNEALAWPRWQSDVGRVSGGGLMLVGIAIALYCSRLFSVVGAGTPVPTEPPEHLVATGVYRRSRNPIYVADITILLGLFLRRGELSLLLYAALFTAAVHWWVVHREEPDLSERLGEEYVRYMQSVPRWVSIGSLRPRRQRGFEQGSGIGSIGLVARDVGAHGVRRQEDDAVAERRCWPHPRNAPSRMLP